MKNLFVSSYADIRDIQAEDLEILSPGQMMQFNEQVDTLVAEPSFYDFSRAEGQELGFPFQAVSVAKKLGAKKAIICLAYSQENAKKYKGYVQDIQSALAQNYESVQVVTVPYPSCGCPMAGTVLVLMASNAELVQPIAKQPTMPADYFPGMLGHVQRNRGSYATNMGGKAMGAIRSDRALLPMVSAWNNKSLMVEYRKGNTTELRRLDEKDVGRLFGVKPQAYSDNLYLCLPKEVVLKLLDLSYKV